MIMKTRSYTNSTTIFHKLPYHGRLSQKKYSKINLMYEQIMKSQSKGTFLTLITEQSKKFERLVLNLLEQKIGSKIPYLNQNTFCPSFEYTKQIQKKLKHYMNEKYPIISIVPTYNSKYLYYGVISAIIHKNSIQNCFPNCFFNIDTISTEYIPIYIKYSTLHLEENGRVKEDESLKFILTKMYMLNKKMNAPFGIIIGRKYKMKKQVYTNCLERIGIVDFSTLDIKELVKPKIQYPYPKLWNCNDYHYQILKDEQITSIYDPRCTAELLGFTDKKAETLNAILNIQRSNSDINCKTKLELPAKRKLYVDFETIPDILNDSLLSEQCDRHEYIFMIGIGWEDDISKEWKYQSFTMKELNIDEEKRILDEFIHFISDSILIHWSSAEPRFLKSAFQRHSLPDKNIHWFDLCQFFRNNSIVIKDCFDYSLKNVVSALYKYGYINTIWNNNMSDGMECASQALQFYKSQSKNKKYNIYNIHNNNIFNVIDSYNEIDCKVMWEIYNFLK